MVNLTIRLNSKGGSAGTASGSGTPGVGVSSTPRVVCGPHLVLSELPLASGVGVTPTLAGSTVIPGIAHVVRRQPGNKVHFCVRCNFPINIYGRLDPCEHVFCLICAKKDPTCFLCEERILRIQKLEALEGIFICGAAGCLRSFLSKPEFEWHIRDAHSDLLPSKGPPPTKPVDVPHAHQSLAQAGTSSSPSQSQPPSPPSNSKQSEHPAVGSQLPVTLAAASPNAEKQVKAQSSRDQSEQSSKLKKLELQLSGVREKEKDKDKDKERERDGSKQVQRDREHGQRGKEQSMKEKEPPLKEREQSHRDRDIDRERDRDREREREFHHRDRDRELWDQQQLTQQQGGPHYPLPPPPPLPPMPFQANTHQSERLVQVPPTPQGVSPNPFPQVFSPFHPQQQENRNARYDAPHHGPFLDPRMAVPPDFQDNNARARLMQQDGERARNMPPQQQEGYGPIMERPGLMIPPHFHGEYGAPLMGMPMGHPSLPGMNRFPDGVHGGGHLPHPPKRGNFVHAGEPGMGHPPHLFGWGVPGNFVGGPGHPQFMNWQPPQ